MDLNFNVDEGFLEVKAKVREFFPKSSYSVRIRENTDQKNTDTSCTLELRYVRQLQFKTITLGSIHGEKMTWMTRKGPNFPRGLKRKVIEW